MAQTEGLIAALRSSDVTMTDEAAAALGAVLGPPRLVDPGEALWRAETPLADGVFVLSGWLGEAIATGQERRQVTDVLLPGDGVAELTGGAPGYDLVALTPARVTRLRPWAERAGAGGADEAALRRCLQALTARQARRLRQHVASNGRRTARERVAHLLLELYERLRIKGHASGGLFDLPIGQSTVADLVGLSYVHVSRVLTQLERSGMIERTRTTVSIADRAALADLCGFRPDYLAPCSGGRGEG